MSNDETIIVETPKPTLAKLLYIIVGLIVFIIAWASLSHVTQHVSGIGRVVTEGKTRLVQHLEGGIVEQILVNEGDSVQKGQVLFRVQNLDAGTHLNEAVIRKYQLQARIERLQAEQKGLEAIAFSDELVADAPKSVLDNERALFQARQKEFGNSVGVLEDQRRQKRLRLENYIANRKNLKSELSTAQEQLALNKKLYEAGSVSRSQYLDSQSRVQNFETRLSQIVKEIPIIRAEESEVGNKLEQAIREQEAEIAEDLADAEVELSQTLGRMDNFDSKTKRAEVVSPVAGIVNKRYVNTIGGVVQPGGVLADIAPIGEDLIVEGQIATDDRPKIYQGLPVRIRLNAYNFREGNTIDGTLMQIGADSLTQQDGQSYYAVKISIKSDDIPSHIRLYPGMIVAVNVQADQITVLEAILKPFLTVLSQSLRGL